MFSRAVSQGSDGVGSFYVDQVQFEKNNRNSKKNPNYLNSFLEFIIFK